MQAVYMACFFIAFVVSYTLDELAERRRKRDQ